VKISTPDQQLLLLQLLDSEPPTPFALATIGGQILNKDENLRRAANNLARKHGTAAASLALPLWARLAKGSTSDKPGEKLEWLTTVLAIDPLKDKAALTALLRDGEPLVVRDAIRSLRALAGRADLSALVTAEGPELLKRDPSYADDLALQPTDESSHRTSALAAEPKEPHVSLGRRVFERANCVSCHTTVSATTLRAPSLAGIGKAQKPEYLVESLFEPSKVIKTGFEIESVTTTDGRVLQGLVKVEGDNLRIITVDKEIVLPKKEVEERAVQKKSLMPDDLWKPLTPGEVRDLMAYLQSLK
jgi:putative heme-binding domain-containing protein